MSFSTSPSPGGGGSARGARRGGVIFAACGTPISPMFQNTRLGLARAVELRIYNLHHAIDVLANIVVPKSKDTIALRLKPFRSDMVAPAARIFAMLRSVNFNDEPGSWAGEVDDKFADRHLAAEVSAVGLHLAKMAPELRFSIRRVCAQASGGITFELSDCVRIRHSVHPTPPAFGGRPSPSRGGWKHSHLA